MKCLNFNKSVPLEIIYSKAIFKRYIIECLVAIPGIIIKCLADPKSKQSSYIYICKIKAFGMGSRISLTTLLPLTPGLAVSRTYVTD